ncbi:hypothetical protein E4K10_26060 [Streptomyces sp. T1317-0309]|nr:hypothetical protein E4K10_26060 [Streptomyces sp. T1317-0309]
MTQALRRPRPRILIAMSCLLAALVVALLPVPPATTPAVAADSGAEDSAVTKSGTKGPYDDFSRLKVTVHQTKNLHSQGVRVSWEGGAPTLPSTAFNVNYFQIMQCWGTIRPVPTGSSVLLERGPPMAPAAAGPSCTGRPTPATRRLWTRRRTPGRHSSRSGPPTGSRPPPPPSTTPTSVLWTPTSRRPCGPSPAARVKPSSRCRTASRRTISAAV